MKYTLSQIAEICRGRLFGRDTTVDCVATDSRHSFGEEEQPLFVAIQGTHHDGHMFIADLYKRGIRAFMIEKPIDTMRYPEAGFVMVSRTLIALHALAADYRNKFKGKVVAITGSQGKSSVKEWLAQALSECGKRVFRSPRSYNSQLGVALSLLMIEGDEDIAVIEAGISKPGEMERLERMIRPDVGIFTTLSNEHSENFADNSDKAEQKAILFRNSRSVVYNSRYVLVENALQKIAPNAKLVNISDWLKRAPFEEAAESENGATVIATCHLLRCDIKRAEQAVADMRPVAMGFSLSEGLGDSLIVSDRHNTDLGSLSIALDYLSGVAGQREKMVILADIMFTNLPEGELYRRVGQMIKNAEVSHLIGIGTALLNNASRLECKSTFYATTEEFLRGFTQDMINGKAVLIRGGYMTNFERIAHLLQRQSHTTVLEVNLDAVSHNLSHFRTMLHPTAKLMAMVKAGGYGNGDAELATTLARSGVDYLAVAFADEGVHLREKGVTMPIVVLNADADSFDVMIAARLEPEIYNFTSLKAFLEAVRRSEEKTYPIHIKIDSGMHRLGFGEDDIPALVEILRQESRLVVVRTIFSHLATADVPEEEAYARTQIATFDKISSALLEALPYHALRHICNSAGIEKFPEAQYDMCRLGIGLYGFGTQGLREVSSLHSRIVQVRSLPAGTTIGYGRAGVLERDSKIATVPIGYADGLDRGLGCGRWSMMVGGKPAPIVGRVCMDSCMIDVTDCEAAEGDRVTIFGGGVGNSAEDMANVLGTIVYEVMTSVSGRVRRVYIKE